MYISIVTVVLNDLDGLKKTWYSLKNQGETSFEWIIKDGGCSEELAHFYKTEVEQFNISTKLIQQKDTSLYDAMNQSMNHVSNLYTLFLNAGDILAAPTVIEKINQNIKISKLPYIFIYGDNIDIDSQNNRIYKKARPLKYLSQSLPTSHQAILYYTPVLKKYRYSPNYKIAADYALTAQIYFDGNIYHLKLDFPVSCFELGGVSSQRRNILLKEGYRIHRNIAKNNRFISAYLLARRYFTFNILDNYPTLYILLHKLFR
ncbi:glycosyltransferase [Bacteroides nordii]|jgi:glycosyltransferase family 2|uniref:glycosyltransferase n=1 Tax=Bacteroides nordii TaxID=291645 RepID=UPI00095F88DD|nr:MAG: hypothetical protein BHV71_03135 [Bacteroides sp. 41_26]